MELTYLLYGLIGIIIISFLITSKRSSSKAKQHKIEKKILEEELQKAITGNDTKNVVKSNIDLIEKYYDQNLNQHRTTHLTTLGISVLGVITILIGIILSLREGNPETARLATYSGIVVELVSAIFFYQNRKITELIKSNHSSLQSGLDIQNAIALTELLPKPEKNKETQKIIEFLLNRATTSDSVNIEKK